MSTGTHTWLCQQIVDHAPDAVIVADRDGVIRLWNAGAEAIFGYRAEDAVGRTLDLIIPAQLRARHWAGYRQVMATGVTRYSREVLAVPARRQDGTRLSLEFTITLVRDAAGGLLGAADAVSYLARRCALTTVVVRRCAGPLTRGERTSAPYGGPCRPGLAASRGPMQRVCGQVSLPLTARY